MPIAPGKAPRQDTVIDRLLRTEVPTQFSTGSGCLIIFVFSLFAFSCLSRTPSPHADAGSKPAPVAEARTPEPSQPQAQHSANREQGQQAALDSAAGSGAVTHPATNAKSSPRDQVSRETLRVLLSDADRLQASMLSHVAVERYDSPEYGRWMVDWYEKDRAIQGRIFALEDKSRSDRWTRVGVILANLHIWEQWAYTGVVKYSTKGVTPTLDMSNCAGGLRAAHKAFDASGDAGVGDLFEPK
jgi:hypothetical protein